MKSPGSSILATSAAKRCVAASLSRVRLKPEILEPVICMSVKIGAAYVAAGVIAAGEEATGAMPAVSGKLHITVVPCPGTELIRTVP